MAQATRKVRTRTIIDDEHDDSQPVVTSETAGEPDAPPPDPLDAAITEITGRAGAQVNIYKLDPRDRSARAWCCDLEDENDEGEFNTASLMKRLQMEFGGGQFELIAREKGVILRRVKFTVLPPPSEKVLQVGNVEDRVAAAIKAAMEPMAALIAARQQNFSLDKVTELALKLGPVVAVMKDLFGGNRQQDSGSELEKYIAMKAKLDALGLGDSEPNMAMQLITAFKEMGGDKLLTGMQQRAAQPRTGQAPVAVAPAMMTAGAAPVNVSASNGNTTPLDPATSMLVHLKPYMAMLKGMAESGVSASDAGARIAAALPDEMVDSVCDAIENGTLLPLLSADSSLTQYSGWLQQVAQAILDNCTEQEEIPATGSFAGMGVNPDIGD